MNSYKFTTKVIFIQEFKLNFYFNNFICDIVCYARVLDYRRKFIEAAQRYNELSYRTIIHDDERMTALRNALICTILASATQQRSRMLATLFKDERAHELQVLNTFRISSSSHYTNEYIFF